MEKLWFKNYLPDTRHHLIYPEGPVFQFLIDSARQYPENDAIIFADRHITFSQLDLITNRFARFLQDKGVRKGDRVAILAPNCHQNVIGFFGALKIGAIVVQNNPMYVERELEHQLNDSGSETIVCLSDLYPKIKNIRANTRLRNMVTFNLDGSPVSTGDDTVDLQAVINDYSSEYRQESVVPEDLALLQYTGGTTGVSKGCMLTHRNLVANVLQTVEVVGKNYRRGDDYVIGVLPLFHVYGLTCIMNMSVYMGVAMILFPRFEPKMVIEAIHRYKVGVFFASPTMLIAINSYKEIGNYDLRCLHTCISGSAPLPNEVKTAFFKLTGVEVVEAYGLSEASPVTHSNPVNGKVKIGSIGLPVSDTDMRVIDINSGAECSVKQTGELWVKGPQVMKGYWNKPEETANVLEDDWLKTGDVIEVDEEGYVYIVSRKKDVIIAGGYNIYPVEVEDVLFTHPKIQESVVVGIPDAYRGETVKAVIVLKESETATTEEIISYCRTKLAAYKVPRKVEFRRELPKSAVGKVLRRVLREE
ncbi:long-chain acyl-CoA synthetase [Desulfotomaculum arcticum]|uniref:Long-chain acyl-CoA synthetase n=1 Tax=Desulfotruncus arcticus DSM 17038 TaxID=1121424 RepID=A0A1I2Y182_9FIRM|nr:long-chain fatty acid--CoA ligase [Desulfotruncus arcticus]SFH19087.1 long-chain acyl-CoA synthetase [Desulfotomaculum arcticum] [Desulfotruncus arcticus DSM 17038]